MRDGISAERPELEAIVAAAEDQPAEVRGEASGGGGRLLTAHNLEQVRKQRRRRAQVQAQVQAQTAISSSEAIPVNLAFPVNAVAKPIDVDETSSDLHRRAKCDVMPALERRVLCGNERLRKKNPTIPTTPPRLLRPRHGRCACALPCASVPWRKSTDEVLTCGSWTRRSRRKSKHRSFMTLSVTAVVLDFTHTLYVALPLARVRSSLGSHTTVKGTPPTPVLSPARPTGQLHFRGPPAPPTSACVRVHRTPRCFYLLDRVETKDEAQSPVFVFRLRLATTLGTFPDGHIGIPSRKSRHLNTSEIRKTKRMVSCVRVRRVSSVARTVKRR